MVRLKSRTQCAINGFWFNQAETGWTKQEWDFELLVREVQAHRQQNPRFNLATDIETIRREVDTQNALRMQSIKGADSYIVDDTGGPAPNWVAPRSRNWLSAAGAVKNVGTGMSVLAEWMGAGALPVPSEQATARARVCTGEGATGRCPKNAKGDWTAFFTEPAANFIRSQLEIRKSLNLSTPYDANLVVCEACECPLKLKVHVPIDHIERKLSPEDKAKLDPRCWILEEIGS